MTDNVFGKRLKYKNNWESDYYYVDGIRLIDLYAVMINGKEYAVKSRVVSIDYSDMDHTYSARSMHHFITEKVFGIETEFDLNTLVNKVKVYAISYLLS